MTSFLNIRLQSRIKPLSNTGVYYFRPIQVKTSRKTRRNQGTFKIYWVTCTCLNTTIIHLELSGDLSTNSFSLSRRRFFAQRGPVNAIQSDNLTTFMSRVKKTNDPIKNLKHDKVTR